MSRLLGLGTLFKSGNIPYKLWREDQINFSHWNFSDFWNITPSNLKTFNLIFQISILFHPWHPLSTKRQKWNLVYLQNYCRGEFCVRFIFIDIINHPTGVSLKWRDTGPLPFWPKLLNTITWLELPALGYSLVVNESSRRNLIWKDTNILIL